MSVRARRGSTWVRLRGEGGFAMPIALSLVLLMLVLVGVAAGDGMFSVRRAVNDAKSRRALQSADAGAKLATLRINAISLQDVLQNYVPCLGRVSGFARLAPVTALGNGWCPPVTEQAGNGASWSYQVSPVSDSPSPSACGFFCTVTTTRSIVSTGTACPPKTGSCLPGDGGSVARRIRVTVSGSAFLVRLGSLELHVLSPARFQQTQYVECRARAASGQPPDNGC
jgi:Tfp pilus assembly protein PilX